MIGNAAAGRAPLFSTPMTSRGNGEGRFAVESAGRAGRRARVDVRPRARQRGMVLPSALAIAAMMLTTSAAWLEASIADRRYSANVHEHLRATHAADGALALCARDLRAGVVPVLPASVGPPEQWRRAQTFEGPAVYEPAPSWPGSARVPQCVVETAIVEGNPDARAYWITARGFGAVASAQAWLQLTIVDEAGRERRAWRRIVAAPSANRSEKTDKIDTIDTTEKRLP